MTSPPTEAVTDDGEGRGGGPLALSIVVPAFNEADRLAEGMRRFDAAVSDGAIDLAVTEFLLVDDGSTDATAAIAEQLLRRLPHHRLLRHQRNRGKGAAVRTGVAAARGHAIAYMDADMAIDPRAVPLLLEGLVDHDIAVGSRALHDSSVESRYVARTLMGHVFNRIVTAGTGLGLRDTQCGFKALRAPVARLLFGLLGIDRFAFDVELLLRAHRLGFCIAEVPVHWKHVEGSTIHPLSDALTMVGDALRSRLGVVPVEAVPAIVVEAGSGPGSGPDIDLTADVSRALSLAQVGPHRASDPGTAELRACLLPGTSDVAVLLPLEPPERVAECFAALRAELEPRRVSRQMIAFTRLKEMRPLADRVLAPA
ncbi:MAG: glycosyltransferase family 2 protein [Acidimicrobiales bacterium]|nr:glycosyltransferase family 2 protein [Acidimicrobiales bacterium]